jgi:hypothetical protein
LVRLVEQQQRRFEQAPWRSPLLLAARDLVRVALHDPLRIRQPHVAEHFQRVRVALRQPASW